MKPTSVKIMGRKIAIKWVPRLEDNDEKVSGLYHPDTKSIEVDPDDPEPWATLLHEMFHAALDIGGVAQVLTLEQEEAVCRAVEN